MDDKNKYTSIPTNDTIDTNDTTNTTNITNTNKSENAYKTFSEISKRLVNGVNQHIDKIRNDQREGKKSDNELKMYFSDGTQFVGTYANHRENDSANNKNTHKYYGFSDGDFVDGFDDDYNDYDYNDYDRYTTSSNGSANNSTNSQICNATYNLNDDFQNNPDFYSNDISIDDFLMDDSSLPADLIYDEPNCGNPIGNPISNSTNKPITNKPTICNPPINNNNNNLSGNPPRPPLLNLLRRNGITVNIPPYIMNPREQFLARLYAIKSENNVFPNGLLADTVSIPAQESEKLLLNDNQVINISYGDKSVCAKVTNYSAPPRTIQMPTWMINKIGAKVNDLLKITISDIKPITLLKVTAPKEITNSIVVLEFELRNKNLLYKGEKVQIKMFEKIYEFVIEKIFNGDTELDSGTLYGNGLTAEVKFDVTVI